MNQTIFKSAACVQLLLALVMATGCATTQPFFAGESPDLQYYLHAATRVEYPDVHVESLAETTESLPPLTLDNHAYAEYWDLDLEECVSIALQNAKFFFTTSGTAEIRQNVGSQFTSGTSDQFGSVYDIAVQQSTTQSIPLTVDGQGNRVLPRGAIRSNQVGGVEDALAEFDAQTSSFLSWNNTDRPRNAGGTNPFNPQFFQADDVTQQSAISKRMATGGVATLRQQTLYGSNNIEVNPQVRNFRSDWTALVEAQIQHPLMRNRGTLVNRIPVVLASLNEDIAITDFESQVRNLVRDVEVAYWDLYLAYRNVATTMVGRNSSQATAQFAKLNLEGGTGTKQDLAQATEQYFQFKGQLESALAGSNLPGIDRQGVYGAERALREKLGLAPTDGRLIRPITEPTIAWVEFDWYEIVAQSLYLAPELRRTKTRIKQNELELITAKNQILPEVNLSLLYRWVGVGDEYGLGRGSNPRFPDPGSTALGELTSGDFQEAAVRLDIQPAAIGSRRELARIRNAQFRLGKERAFLQEQERLYVSQLSDAIGKLRSHYGLVQTNARRWQASEQEVQARLAEYKGGRTAVNTVLQSQIRRAQAQIDYYRSLTEYNKSINYVHYLKGTLLQQNGIDIAEGPWHAKAYWDALERARERSAGHPWQYGVQRPAAVRQGEIAAPESVPTRRPTTVHDAELPAPASGIGLPDGGFPDVELHEFEGALNGPLGWEPMLGEPGGRGPVSVNDTPLSRLQTPTQMMRVEPTGHAAVVGSGVERQADGPPPTPVRRKAAWVPSN